MAVTVSSIAAAIVGDLGPGAFTRRIGGSIVRQVMYATGALGIVTPGRELHRILSGLGVHVSRNTVITVGRSVYNIAHGHRFSAEEIAETIDLVPPFESMTGVTWRQSEPYAYSMRMVPLYADGERGAPVYVTTTYAERVSWRTALEDAELAFGEPIKTGSPPGIDTGEDVESYEFEPHMITHRHE